MLNTKEHFRRRRYLTYLPSYLASLPNKLAQLEQTTGIAEKFGSILDFTD